MNRHECKLLYHLVVISEISQASHRSRSHEAMADVSHDRADTPSRTKRQKTSSDNMDPKSNPYLAHMYSDTSSSYNGYDSGYASNGNGSSPLRTFRRHQTSAAIAKEAENGPNNAFNGKPLSKKYLSILETRRNLPVHAQRYVETIPRLRSHSH